MWYRCGCRGTVEHSSEHGWTGRHGRRSVAGYLCLVMAVLLLPWPAFSQDEEIQTQVSLSGLQLLADFRATHGTEWRVRWSEDGQRVVSLSGGIAEIREATAATAAAAFLRLEAGLFALQPDLDDLSLLDERESLGGRHVEWRQVFRDLPVENARVKAPLTD